MNPSYFTTAINRVNLKARICWSSSFWLSVILRVGARKFNDKRTNSPGFSLLSFGISRKFNTKKLSKLGLTRRLIRFNPSVCQKVHWTDQLWVSLTWARYLSFNLIPQTTKFLKPSRFKCKFKTQNGQTLITFSIANRNQTINRS